MAYNTNDLIKKYDDLKQGNNPNFVWWIYAMSRLDLQTAFAFVKLFSPTLIQMEGSMVLEEYFSMKAFEHLKQQYNKTEIEKIMNLREIKDFFESTETIDDSYHKQLCAIGEALKYFWGISFEQQCPDRTMVVDVFEEGGRSFITVHEKVEREQEMVEMRETASEDILGKANEPINSQPVLPEYPPISYPIYVARTYPNQEGVVIVYSVGYDPDNLIGKFGINSTDHRPYVIDINRTMGSETYEIVVNALKEFVSSNSEHDYPQKLVIGENEILDFTFAERID